MSLATGEADCDCTSILTSALLLNMGIDHAFEVVAHLEEEPDVYTHVFVSAGSGAGRIYIDAVPEIEYFDAREIQFFKQMTYPMSAKTVMLMGLSSEDMALKRMLEAQYMELEHFANQARRGGTLSRDAERELAILKAVIAKIGTEELEQTLLAATRNSQLASDAYGELYSELTASGLSGLGFLKNIRKALDKIGDTGIGKAFRTVRDKAIRPAIRQLPGGAAIDKAASTAGKIVNAVTADAPSQSQYQHPATSYLPDNPAQQAYLQDARLDTLPASGGDSISAPAPEEDRPFGERVKSFIGKHKKWIIVAVVVLVLVGLGYWAYKKRAEAKKKSLRGGRRRRRKQPTNAQILAALQGAKRKRPAARRRRRTVSKARRYRINVRKSAPKRRRRRKTARRRKKAA